jgi:hypothetical protein
MEAGSFVFNVVSLERADTKRFEDRENRLLDMKKMMLKSLYIWRGMGDGIVCL